MLSHALAEIRQSHPTLTLRARVCVEAMCLIEGPIGHVDQLARFLGLPSRFALARQLKREGCPSLRRLGGWLTVLSWALANEREGVSLARLARRAHRRASACYRLVKMTTGLPWQEVCQRAAGWVEHELIRQFEEPQSSPASAKLT